MNINNFENKIWSNKVLFAKIREKIIKKNIKNRETISNHLTQKQFYKLSIRIHSTVQSWLYESMNSWCWAKAHANNINLLLLFSANFSHI